MGRGSAYRLLTRPALGHIPIGCQTVFSSRNAAISYGLCASGLARTIRFTFSAPSRSSSATSPSAPVTSSATTSMCDASAGASSRRSPVMTFTTPAGTPAGERRELGLPRLHHLGHAIEDLSAVVRGRSGPARACLARDAHRVANVFSRSARDVRALGVVRATRLGPREGAPDEELVRLS